MTDELHGHTGLGVELFFEGENAECARKPSADQIHAPRPPGPELRANIVDVSNALGTQFARQAEMKTRKVRQNRQRRVAAFRLVHKPPHRPPQRGQALQYLGDSDDRNFRVVRNDLNARSAHLRSAHPENRHVHTLLQSSGDGKAEPFASMGRCSSCSLYWSWYRR